MSAFKIDKNGTLDVTGIDCNCYLDVAIDHGSAPWTADDIPAIEASLCADCLDEHDVVVLLDDQEDPAS